MVQEDARAESPDVDYMSTLSEIFEGMAYVKFIPLDPNEWIEQSESLLSEPECAQTLFLFDQDMSKRGGRTNAGSAIVGSVMTREAEACPLCAILTHTADPENQDARWKELAADSGIDRDRFLVIPKRFLTADLNEFTRQMKAAVLAPSFLKLKELSSTILSSSLDKARQELDKLTVLDFDHMVMRVAHGEGVWEGQLLFRLHGLFHRMEAEQQARRNTGLSDLISKIRKVSHIPEMGTSHASEVVRSIRHAELYEEGVSINSAHLDISTGDVFEITSPKGGTMRRIMVVTQACDLAIRPDGKRKVQHTLLLGVVPVSNNEVKLDHYMELPYFHKADRSGKMAVDFLSTSVAPCWALDTCVLNDEGKCGLRLDAEPPQGLLPGWGGRFEEVRTEAQRLHDQCDVSCLVEEGNRKSILERLAPLITSCGAVRVLIEDNEVKVPLQRVMRLRIEMAMEVVRQYAAYISRTPHEVDLARKA